MVKYRYYKVTSQNPVNTTVSGTSKIYLKISGKIEEMIILRGTQKFSKLEEISKQEFLSEGFKNERYSLFSHKP